MEFKLATGREVVLTGFFIGETNTWVDYSQDALADKVLTVVRRVFPAGDFHVIGNELSKFICVAGFNSTPLNDPGSYGSWLHLVWFVEENDNDIRTLVEIGLSDCDWESYAQDIYRGPHDD